MVETALAPSWGSRREFGGNVYQIELINGYARETGMPSGYAARLASGTCKCKADAGFHSTSLDTTAATVTSNKASGDKRLAQAFDVREASRCAVKAVTVVSGGHVCPYAGQINCTLVCQDLILVSHLFLTRFLFFISLSGYRNAFVHISVSVAYSAREKRVLIGDYDNHTFYVLCIQRV